MKKELLIILGNQLFPINKLKTIGCGNIFMAEDIGLCTYIKHHKQKIAFFLTSMRDYRDELSANQYNVFYQENHNKYNPGTNLRTLLQIWGHSSKLFLSKLTINHPWRPAML